MPENVEVIPLLVYSDAPFIGNLNPEKSHTFSCYVDIEAFHKFKNQDIDYIVKFTNVDTN